MPNVSMTAPYNPYTADQQAIERQRQLAELLQQQSMQPLGPHTASGPLGTVNTPMSWTEGLAKLMQAYTGKKGQEYATEQEKALGQRYSSDLSGVLQRAMQAGAGSPERPAQLDPQEMQQMADQGTPQPPNIPAQAPDRQAMASILMQHPATQGLAMQQMSTDMQRQALIAALGGGAGGVSGGGSTSSSIGGPAGGVPMAVWLQTDPTGKSYAEQLAKDHEAANKPIVNRGFGLGTMQNGKYQPDPGSLEQVKAVKGVTEPYEPPVSLKTSSGQELQLARPEWAAYQQSGVLPQRITGTPQQGMVPQQDMEAFGRVASADKMGIPMSAQGGLGQIGVSQSQPEQVQQEEQMAQAKSYGAGRGTLLADKPTATLSLNDTFSNLDRLAAVAGSIADHPGLKGITGIPGKIPDIPGSNAADARAKLETLKSQAAFTVLQAMRNASKTGGALGQVSDREEQMLANNLAALSTAQSPQALRAALKSIQEWSQGSKGRLKNAYEMTYHSALPAPPAGAASIPQGVDPKLWAVMTPQEKALWTK